MGFWWTVVHSSHEGPDGLSYQRKLPTGHRHCAIDVAPILIVVESGSEHSVHSSFAVKSL